MRGDGDINRCSVVRGNTRKGDMVMGNIKWVYTVHGNMKVGKMS